MSLHVELLSPEQEEETCFNCGSKYTCRDTLYSANITHNLNEMAKEAGIYEALWRPYRLSKTFKENYSEDISCDEELFVEEVIPIKAKDIISIIEKGLKDLKSRPKHFKQFNSPNGWGLYKHFVPFVEKYLKACKENPEAIVKVDR